MTSIANHSLTPTPRRLDGGARPDRPRELEASPEQRRVAAQFEAIFLRQLMRSLETSGGMSGSGGSSGRVYRSMMVGAIADTAAEGGGIGLSELVLRALMATPSVGAAGAAEAPAPGERAGAAQAPAPGERAGAATGPLPPAAGRGI